MQLKRVDFQRDIDPPGRSGKTAQLSDTGEGKGNYEIVFKDGLVTVTDRVTAAAVYVPVHNVARMEPHPQGAPKAGKR